MGPRLSMRAGGVRSGGAGVVAERSLPASRLGFGYGAAAAAARGTSGVLTRGVAAGCSSLKGLDRLAGMRC